MLILQKKTGAGVPQPPVQSPIVNDDPLVHASFQGWDLYLKPDGTKIYIAGYKTPSTDTGYIHEYDMTTPYDPASMVHSGTVLVTNTYEAHPTGIEFKPDGTKMFIGGQNQQVFQYNLSTPWDLSTVTYFGASGSLAGHIHGIVIKPDDGSRLYITSPHQSPGNIREYQLSTHWDITSASFNTHTTVTGSNGNPSGLFFKPDGEWLYQTSYTSDSTFQHGMTVPWSLSTTAAELTSVNLSSVSVSPMGGVFGDDGKYMYIYAHDLQKVVRFSLGTDWTLSSIILS